MASKVRIELNSGGVRQLLRSPQVQADLRSRAGRVAASAGAGMEPRSGVGRARARAAVITTTYEARKAEATRRALSSAIWSGR